MSKQYKTCHTLLVFVLLICLAVTGTSTQQPDSLLDRHHARPRRHIGMRGEALKALRRQSNLTQPTIVARGQCDQAPPATITAPKSNLWRQMTVDEVESVANWLLDQRELNLTSVEDAGEWSNTIVLVETLRPNKSQALPYLYGDQRRAPRMYARVTLDQRAMEEAVLQDILVGPLPINPETASWRPLGYPFNKSSGDGKVRNLLADFEAQERWLFQHTREISDITWDLFNGTILGLSNDTMDVWGIDPMWQEEGGRVRRWDTFWNLPNSAGDGHAQSLLPTGLFVLSDFTGRDPKQWKLEGWLYNGIFYNSTEEFRAAHRRPGFEKIGVSVDGDWTSGDHQGPVMPLDDRAPPHLVAPAGSRFSLDEEQRYVEWMGFSFFLGFTRDGGTSLHDIRFKGERVLFLDSFYGFGQYAVPLVPGFDCPGYATYLDTAYFAAETTWTTPQSICLFESMTNYPLQRHSTEEYTSVTRNEQFVVRQVATVFNYDYIVSYTFSLDGSISVDIHASGYIQAGHRERNQDYGFAINDHLSGSMHDHVLNFKLDFDVLGTSNTVELVRTVPVTTSYPWPGGASRNTMQLRRSVIANEDQGQVDWEADGTMQLLVVNTGAKNRFGESRGYRIVPQGAGKLTVRDSSNLRNAARWTEHDVHVTRQKDEEPWASHTYQNQDVHNPPVDFSRFLTARGWRRRTLFSGSTWACITFVTNSMDLPHTLTTSAHTGIRLEPSNFFEVNPYRETVQMVRISRDEYGQTSNVDTFGQLLASCDLHVEPVEAALWGYSGGDIVRQARQDPNNPSRFGNRENHP